MKAIRTALLLITLANLILSEESKKQIDKGQLAEQTPTPNIPLTKSPTTNINKVETDQDILTHTKEKETRLNDPMKDKCNKELMGIYNLSGLDKPATKVHKYCPNIKRSCCNDGDEARTAEMWTSQQEGLVEKYYENFLAAMRYLLGYSQEIMNLSIKFANESTERKLKIKTSIERHLMQTNAQLLKRDEDTQSIEV